MNNKILNLNTATVTVPVAGNVDVTMIPTKKSTLEDISQILLTLPYLSQLNEA